jgi:hypothetical protein
MLSNRVIKAPLLWCLLACLMLTGVVWLLGQRLSRHRIGARSGSILGCRLRDCAADWRCADGRTTEPQRRGLGHPEHISAGRVGARHRHPRHCAVRHTRCKVRHRAGRSWRIGSPASAACRRSQGQRGSRDSKPGCQSGYCSCRRACAGRLHRRLAGSRFDSRGLPRHRTGGKPVSGEPTPASIG